MAVHFLTRWLIFTSPPKGLPCAHYDFHLRWLLQLLWKICNDFCSFLLIISFSNPNLILIPATFYSHFLISHFPPLPQRHNVRVVPVSEVTSEYKSQRFTYWVYGTGNTAYAPDYPQKCCCGCSILWQMATTNHTVAVEKLASSLHF